MAEPVPIDPDEALQRLLERIEPVGTETVDFDPSSLSGRVLAERVALDRDSPACDVSAMDGFAVRLHELQAGPLSVAGECRIGEPPATLAEGEAKRIYAGSPLPDGADTVVRLEWVTEAEQAIRLNEGKSPRPGGDIRRRGENAAAGAPVLESGEAITPAAMTALATIGPERLRLHRPLRLAVLTTGNELLDPNSSDAPSAWRLRDSNGPSLEAMFAPLPWVGSVERARVGDQLDELTERIARLIKTSDALVLTGGVSKGAYDHVPSAVEAAGGETLFHRLNARPGRPTLGAVIGSKPVLGLPGNPLAVLTTGRRLLAPVLRKRAGFAVADPPKTVVELTEWWGKSIDLAFWRPVHLAEEGLARLASLRGSGDTCGPASTDGFIEAPPGSDGVGPYPFTSWTV